MAIDLQSLISKQMELSFTPPHAFYMIIERMPVIMYTVQRIQIPVVSGDEMVQSTPMNPGKTMMPGTSMEYGVLSVDFILDKHLKNYREVLVWLKSNYSPDGKGTLSTLSGIQDQATGSWSDQVSNIIVIGTDAANKPIMEWTFYDAFPISVDGPMYDATMPDIEYLTSNVTFRHKFFSFATYTDGVFDNNPI